MTTEINEDPTHIDMVTIVNANAKDRRCADNILNAFVAKFEKAAEMRNNQRAIIGRMQGQIGRLEAELSAAHSLHAATVRDLETKIEHLVQTLSSDVEL